jgi:hypothetical protein
MNLLYDFLKNLEPAEKEKLKALKIRGKELNVWLTVNQQSVKGNFDKQKILDKLGISSAYLDKITSELLSKCYQHLFGNDRLKLLRFLVTRDAYLKHYYTELARAIKHLKDELDITQQRAFYRTNLEYIHVFVPIAYREDKVLKTLLSGYQALFKGAEKKEADFFVECKRMVFKLGKLFAAGHIRELKSKIEKELNALGGLPPNADEELSYDYYWTKIYFYHSIEEFEACYELTTEALAALQKFKSPLNSINMLRIQLKQAEQLYFLSRFDESFSNFKRVVNQPLLDKIPDRGYYLTKYVQICLITGHIAEAGKILEKKLQQYGNPEPENLAPREIFSFIKYFLFKGQYDKAFKFIRQGFAKNPKGKYFQYEVELRHLETAYFFLSGQFETALLGCEKHLKFLRAHGFGLQQSSYPYYYVLIKAIYEKNRGIRDFTGKEDEMLKRYLTGSYAIYGKLLERMLALPTIRAKKAG